MIISTRYDKAFNRVLQCIPNLKNSQENRNRWKFLHTLIQIHLIPTASTLLTGRYQSQALPIRKKERIPTVSTTNRQCPRPGK